MIESGKISRLATVNVVLALGLISGSGNSLGAAPGLQGPAPGLFFQQAEDPPPERREYQLRRRLLDSTAGEESWEPEMGLPAIFVPDQLLGEAEQAVAAGRLFEPADDNALARYLLVLEREPGNARAEAGIDDIARRLVDQGTAALADGRVVEAARLLAVASRVRANAPGVAELRAGIEALRELASLLDRADQALAEGALLEPEGESAFALYAQVLDRDPGNAEAMAGMAAIEAELLSQAGAALAEDRFEAAIDLVAAAARVAPDSPAVAEARVASAGARESRARQLLEQGQAALAALEADRAEQLADQIEALQPQIAGLSELRQGVQRVRAYASLRPGQAIRDGDGPEMVVIPIGSFMMGSPESESERFGNEGPQAEVRFTRGFALSRTEITIGQFRTFVEATRYRTDAERAGTSTVYDSETGEMASGRRINWQNDYSGGRGRDEYPVVHVSWNDATAYTNWLSETTGRVYRLPSEAEFEYALRAGSSTRYWWGDGNPQQVVENLTGDGDRSPERRSWNNAFPNYNDRHWGPAPVATYPANSFGLHDMGGNVSEWTLDCWSESLAGVTAGGWAQLDSGCERRAIRGGSWVSTPQQARSAVRLNAPRDWRSPQVGFRVLRELL